MPSQESRRRGYAKLAMVIGAALASIAIFAGAFAWMMSSGAPQPEAQLNSGLRLLKQGTPQEAMLRVASIDVETLEEPAAKAKHHLVLGAAALDEAEHAEYRQAVIKKATESRDQLKKAKEIGFPRGYEGLGHFLLGKAFFLLMQWEEAVKPLEIAIAEWPSGRTKSLERLIDIDLGSAKPDIERLRQRLDQWAGLAGLTGDERDLETIKRIEVELANGEYDQAKRLAGQLSADSRYSDDAKYLLLEADLNRIEKGADKEADQLESLLQTAEAVARSPIADAITRRRSRYFSGMIQQRLKRPKAALTVFSQLRQEAPQTVESAVASMEEIRSLIELGRYDDASKTMRVFANQFGDKAWYANRWYPLERMRSNTKELGQLLLRAKAYPETAFFAERLPPYCERSDSLKLQAEAYKQWAQSLKGAVWNRDPLLDIRQVASRLNDASQVNKLQHELYSKAAKAYKELAMIEMRSPEYRDLVWSAIDCSQEAGELAQSNAMINDAIDFEPRDSQPRSILKMAENHFAMQEFDKSLSQLRRCIGQFPSHPLAYQARLNAARILSEQSDFEPAESYLDENLFMSELTPSSPVWRESLFELGKLYYRRGEEQYATAAKLRDATLSDEKNKRMKSLEASNALFLKSIKHLEEWIKRYAEDERRFETLYSIGQAYQMAAQWNAYLLDEKLLPSEDQIRTRRLEHRKLLDAARQVFKSIRDGINATKDWSMLNLAQQRILRNSYFAEADLMFQAKSYDEALSAYRNIANRLLNEPESLEALAQAAECLKQLGRFEESQRVIVQAKDVLQQIPPQRDDQFIHFTRFSRSDWNKHLDWMSRNTLK